MVRGRKPTPTALKLVKGEQKSRVNKDEPIPDDGIPVCPSPDERVQAVWDYTVEQLSRMRVLTMADRDVLALFCQAVVTWRGAQARIAREGMILQLPEGGTRTVAAHPAYSVMTKAENTIMRCAGEFGLTPAARTRIQVGAQQPEMQQGAARLLS